MAEQYRNEFVKNNLTVINNVENKGISKTQKGEYEMSKITKNKKEIYMMRIQKNGKRFYVYSKNKEEVKQKFKKLQSELRKDRFVYKNIKLQDFYKEWFEIYKKPFVTKATAENIKIYFEKHILKEFKNYGLKDLTTYVLQKYLNGLTKNRTKELIVTYLQALITKAYNLNLITINPFNNIVKDKKINNVRNSLTFAEQIKLIEHLKKTNIEYYYLTMIYLLTGIRRSEIVSLEAKNDYLIIHGTKTKNSIRQISISEKFKNQILNKINVNELRLIKDKYLSQKYQLFFKELGIENKTLHCLRHTFATNLYYLGCPAKQVQQWLGHSSIMITLDIYTNLHDDEIKKLKDYWDSWYPRF